MHPPRRLLSLSPNVSMILFALGADDWGVGRTQHCLSSIGSYVNVWGITESEVAPRLRHWAQLPVVGTWPEVDPSRVTAPSPRPDPHLWNRRGWHL